MTSIADITPLAPSPCGVSPSGDIAKSHALLLVAIPSADDVRSAAEHFQESVGGKINPDYDLSVTGDGSFRWDADSNYIRSEFVISGGTLGLKSRNLLAEKRAAERAADAKLNGVDDSYLASMWWTKYDTSCHYDDEGEFQFYEVTRRDLVGRPTEITDRTTGEVLTKENSINKNPIHDWSLRSIQKMTERLYQLDYATFAKWLVQPPLGKLKLGKKKVQIEGPRNAYTNGQLGMITLTLPGDWLTVAPTGKAFKRLFSIFTKRWIRAVGDWRVLWKLEFQERGAPHLHILAYIPMFLSDFTPFRDWLSVTWCDVVSHPDPEERAKHLNAGTGIDFKHSKMTDPILIGAYFIGHSLKTEDGKKGQHKVPEEWQGEGMGPGRFWGYTGLKVETVSIEMGRKQKALLQRELRKLLKARDFKAAVRRELGKAKREKREPLPIHLIPVKKRRMRGLGRGGSQRGGTVFVKNALPVARAYGLWIKDMTPPV